MELRREPFNESNKSLLVFAKLIILRHEEWFEECTCDVDDEDCWYRYSDKEMDEHRIDYLIKALTEIKEFIGGE